MTAQAVGEVLAFGVAVALSPLAIVAVVVLLVAPGGTRAAWAFVAAWVLSLGVLATAVLLLADGADASTNDGPAAWVDTAKIVLGILLLAFAARQWRGRGAGEQDPPGWLRKLDDVTAARAAALAVGLAAVKPKNLLLTIGAAVSVAQVGASAGGQAVALAVFVVLGTAGPGLPLAVHVLMPGRGPGLLTAMRDWMVRENAAVIAVLALVMAAKLLGDALR